MNANGNCRLNLSRQARDSSSTMMGEIERGTVSMWAGEREPQDVLAR